MSNDDALSSRPIFLLLTCEHGGRDVPREWRRLYRGSATVLAGHRGYDIGALPVALHTAAALGAPIVFSTTTRLLVDLNRSPDSPTLFSEFTRDLPVEERDMIIDRSYTPHRGAVAATVGSAIASGFDVLHVAVHSCADVLDGVERKLECSLLFDPARGWETTIAERWRDMLHVSAPDWRCPFNTPYLGTDDGLTTALRPRFPPDRYAGIEVELRQGIVRNRAGQRLAGERVSGSLGMLLGRPGVVG